MSFFSWLFRKDRAKTSRHVTAGAWVVSENGNPTRIEGSTQITVFQQDQGWKYCIADITDRDAPHFSEAYGSELQARQEGMAHFRGQPLRHQPLSAASGEERKMSWEAQIRKRENLIEDLHRHLAENHDLGITELRKPEAKISSHLKQLDWQIAEYRKVGVSAEFIALAEVARFVCTTFVRSISGWRP